LDCEDDVLVLLPHPDNTSALAASKLSAAPDRLNFTALLFKNSGDEHNSLCHRLEPNRGTCTLPQGCRRPATKSQFSVNIQTCEHEHGISGALEDGVKMVSTWSQDRPTSAQGRRSRRGCLGRTSVRQLDHPAVTAVGDVHIAVLVGRHR